MSVLNSCSNRNKYSIYIALIIFLSCIFTHVNAKCSYIETNGFLDCRNRNLTSVPDDVRSFTKIVDLSQNRIQHIDRNAFNRCIFVTEIYLADNNLTSIAHDAFSQLQHLQLLDLSNNHLTAFQLDTPVSLQILYLDRNPLHSDYIFSQRIQFLKYVSLVGANLTKSPTSLFSPFLPVLEYVDLQDNPSLAITVDDLAKLKHLRVLYLSPRIFVARSKIQKCREFVRKARELKIEVKAFACYPEESFETRGRYFERTYQVDEAMFDHPENVLTFPVPNAPEQNDTCLHDLQKLVSNGMTNFVRSLLVEKIESRSIDYKIKEPIRLEDYSISIPRSRLYGVHMSGFPLFNIKKNPILSIATVDAEFIKLFQTEFKTADANQDLEVSGHFEVDKRYGDFICKFSNASYHTKRAMRRRYDFRIWPVNVYERLSFEKMDCTTSLSNQYSSNVIEMVLAAMSKNWLDSACIIGGIVAVEPALKGVAQRFALTYRDRVLEKVIEESIDYLQRINIDSFDVTPSLNVEADGGQTSIPEMTYNIRIHDLFRYENRTVSYKTEATNGSMRVYVETTIAYREDSPTKLAITAKSNPAEAMLLYLHRIEFNLQLLITRTNKVHKLEIEHVDVRVVDKPTARMTPLIVSFVKKYLDMELAKEFKRSLTFLTNKVDFYSLNVA